MKHLYLVRHAKSSWEQNVSDHKRPLNERGFSDAHLVSNYLLGKISLPDLVLSSDALRAKTTASIFMYNLGLDESIFNLYHNLYDFEGSQLIQTIKDVEDSVETLMVFGHNYAITKTVNAYGNTYIDNVPTCGFAHLAFDTERWSQIKPGKTVLTVFPKQLKK